MVSRLPKGVKQYLEPKTGKRYFYHRPSGKRLLEQYGTDKFAAELARVDFEHRTGLPAPSPQPGTVYAVGFADYVKIGYARCLKDRIATLQTGLPVELIVYGSWPGTKSDEGALHARFATERLRGDWFRLTPEVHQVISDLAQKDHE